MDDVQHLRAGGTAREESYLFLADSKLRDRDVFPTPSEYEIQFQSPFHRVFSLDLIDATVPRTEYTVEQGRNTLAYAMAHTGGTVHTAVVPPGDYNLPQLVEALNAAFPPGHLAVRPAGVPSEITNKLVFSAAGPFRVEATASGLRDALGFANPVRAGDIQPPGPYTAGGPQYAAPAGWTPVSPATDAFLSVPVTTGGALAMEGPVPIDDAEPVYAGRTVRQRLVAGSGGAYVSAVTVRATPVGTATTADTLTVTVRRVSDNAVVAAAATATYAQTTSVDAAWIATWTAGGTPVAQGEALYVDVSSAAGDAANHLAVYRAQANVPLAGGGADDGDVFVVVANVATPIPQVEQDLCIDVAVATQAHQITSPGLANLTGERYIMIRCPEIEQYLYRDRAYEKYHAGLGMVKLAGYGYREQRYDFVSFPPRRFHPIGKLSKLTIRLEKPGGELYDAHGVDHTLLLVVRYYAVGAQDLPGGAAVPSVLAPGYLPDLHAYLGERRLADEDDERFNQAWR
jgi:hypothetical protein